MIDTFSSFYFDTKVLAEPFNGYMNLDEGSGEILITIPVSSYTLNSLVLAVRVALNGQGTLEYTVGVDRVTRKITISAPSAFDLLISTGSNADSSIWSLLGFETSADKTGLLTYTSDGAIGKSYVPQFRLQSYVDPETLQSKNQASKNVAADGVTVEVVSFGLAKFIEMDLKFITSRLDISDGINILHNATGREDAIEFLKYITSLNQFEFNPDVDNPGTFFTVIVESMPEFQDGTGYRLRELFAQNLRDVYETGVIKLRVVD